MKIKIKNGLAFYRSAQKRDETPIIENDLGGLSDAPIHGFKNYPATIAALVILGGELLEQEIKNAHAIHRTKNK
jgi:hypothetical protein